MQPLCDINDTTIKEFIDMLTMYNQHTDVCLLETIVSGNDNLICKACEVKLQHEKDGELTSENYNKREQIYKELKEYYENK